MTNYFELFELKQEFALDQQQLEEHYIALQQQLHPDRFVGESSRAQSLSLQRAAEVNAGYRVLKEPLSRAKHLLECLGCQQAPEATVANPQLLMRQMEWRETLEELSSNNDSEGLRRFEQQLQEESEGDYRDFASALECGNLTQATEVFTQLQFAHRCASELQAQLKDSG